MVTRSKRGSGRSSSRSYVSKCPGYKNPRYATNLKKREFIDIVDTSYYNPDPKTKYQVYYAKKGGSVNPVVGETGTKTEARKIASKYKNIMNS